MRPQGVIAGELSQYDEPNWQPLLDLIGLELVDWFMWMHEIELEDSSRVHAYKHTATRRYFHIAEDGRTFLYAGRNRYREIDRPQAFAEAFFGLDRLADAAGLPDTAAQQRAFAERHPRRSAGVNSLKRSGSASAKR